jgi:hypothetical protein
LGGEKVLLAMITPLQPGEYFAGKWIGKGIFQFHGIFHLLIPDQSIEYIGKTEWITDEFWISFEEFKLSRSGNTNRTTYIKRTGEKRLHTTCDDIVGGADIYLRENGFSHSPYYFRSPMGKGFIIVKCIDNAIINENGILHDKIKMYYAGLHLATTNIEITIIR